MKPNDTVILEIAVDRLNEKGVFVAKEMLSTLHDVLNAEKRAMIPPLQRRPQFRFFVMHTQGRVRFFFETEKKYREFLESQLYAHYSNIEINESELPFAPESEFFVQQAMVSSLSSDLIKLYVNLKDRTEKETIDPLSSLTSVLAKSAKDEVAFFRVDFAPLEDKNFREGTARDIISHQKMPDFWKRFLLSHGWWARIIFFPFILFFKFCTLLFGNHTPTESEKKDTLPGDDQKFDGYGYSTRIIIASQKNNRTRELASSLTIFASPSGAKFAASAPQRLSYERTLLSYSPFRSILSVTELAGLVHMPTVYVKTPGVNWVVTRRFEPPHNLPPAEKPNTPIGISNFRGSREEFGIQPVDRARHTYIIGKTGMGKSTLLENMIYSDILAGRGVGLIDPHGDLAETILRSIPKSRTNDIVLFDPADTDFPIAFNMLESPSPELRPIVGSGLVSIFKKMFADSWGPRLEYILRNTILTLLTVPDATLVSIPLILTHESYRKKIISKLDDPLLVQFWTQEFDKMAPNMVSEAVNPILNKVGQFLSSPILRNILGQPKNPFSMRWVMDNGKIFIVNLSK